MSMQSISHLFVGASFAALSIAQSTPYRGYLLLQSSVRFHNCTSIRLLHGETGSRFECKSLKEEGQE